MNEGAGHFWFPFGLARRPRLGNVCLLCYLLVLVPPGFSRSPAPLHPAARVFPASRAVPLPVGRFLPACDEAAGWIWTNDETSPSLARQPNEESKSNGAKDNQRQSEGDAN